MKIIDQRNGDKHEVCHVSVGVVFEYMSYIYMRTGPIVSSSKAIPCVRFPDGECVTLDGHQRVRILDVELLIKS